MGEAESGDVRASHTQLRLSACSTEEKGDRVSECAVCLGSLPWLGRETIQKLRETQYFNCGLFHHHHQVSETFDVQN